MHALARLSGIALVVTSVAATAVAATPGAALAAKGGKNTAQVAALAVNPNPASAFSYVQVSGCGYAADQPAMLSVVTSQAIAGGALSVDANGCAAGTWYVYGPGTYTFNVFQDLKGSSPTLVASTNVSVQ